MTSDYELKIADILLQQNVKLSKLMKNDEPTNILLAENEKIAKLICSKIFSRIGIDYIKSHKTHHLKPFL